MTHIQLRKHKADTLRLCLAFVFATKHYLRGEDGVNYADYHGVLPSSFARFDEVGYNTQTKTSSGVYSATSNDATPPSRDGSLSLSGRTSPDGKPDATKRIRVKRSKPQIPDHSTPLLQGTHRSVEFHPFADEASLPLPLMCVLSIPYLNTERCYIQLESHMNLTGLFMAIGGMDFWKPWAQRVRRSEVSCRNLDVA